jgi:predicted ArsR family transcriptional regulator
LPERRYDLAGDILARAIDRATDSGAGLDEAVRDVATEAGRLVGREGPATGSDFERATAVLAAHGYEPRERDDAVVLVNCPFDALARTHTALVCGLNKAFVGGVLDGLGCAGLEACLDPEPGLCCVKTRHRG